MSVVVLKRPALLPLQEALSTLLTPSNQTKEGTQQVDMLSRIRKLKKKLSTASDKDCEKASTAEITLLVDLLADDE